MAFFTNFTGPNGTTPDQLGFTEFVITAVAKPFIENNRLRSALSTGSSIWLAPVTASNQKAEMTFTSYTAGVHYLYLRYTDSNNYYGLRIVSGTGSLRVYKRVAGVETFAGVTGGFTLPAKFSMEIVGDTISVSVNDGTPQIFSGYSDLASGKPGFSINNNATQIAVEIDNFFAGLPGEAWPTAPGFSRLELTPVVQPPAVYVGGPDNPGLVADYFIDFDAGNDANPGTRALPWKHHPDDPMVVGGSVAALAVRAGKTFSFRSGVDYRGTIAPSADDMTLFGKGYGAGRAHLSGWEQVAGLASAAADPLLAGNPFADQIEVADLGYALSTFQFARCGTIDCFQAQFPPPADLALPTDTRENARNNAFEWIAMADAIHHAGTSEWSFKMPITTGLLGTLDPAGIKAVAVVSPNATAYDKTIVSMAGDMLRISGFAVDDGSTSNVPDPGLAPGAYKMALIGHPHMIRQPGQIATVGTKLYIWRPNAAPVLISTRKRAIDNSGAGRRRRIDADGFRVSGLWGTDASTDGGMAYFKDNDDAPSAVTLTDLVVHSTFSAAPVGAVHSVDGATKGTKLTIKSNLFHRLYGRTGGVRIAGAGEVIADYNACFEVSQTAIYYGNVKAGRIWHNRVGLFASVHGNGMSVYQDSENVSVRYNFILCAARPLTIDNSPPTDMQPMNLDVGFNVAPLFNGQFWDTNDNPVGITLAQNTIVSGYPGSGGGGYRVGKVSAEHFLNGNILAGLIKHNDTALGDYATSGNYFPEATPAAPLTAGGGDKVEAGIWYQSLDQASQLYLTPVVDGAAASPAGAYPYYGALMPDGLHFVDGTEVKFWEGINPDPDPEPITNPFTLRITGGDAQTVDGNYEIVTRAA